MRPKRVGRRGAQAPAIIAAELLERRRLLSAFTVTNTDDSGPGSLRQAIADADASPDADVIGFSIAGPGIHTILPLTDLPALFGKDTIDGFSQPGSVANSSASGNDGTILIRLDGKNQAVTGLQIGDRCTVRGLIVSGFNGDGLIVAGSGCVISGNVIRGNGGDGVRVNDGMGLLVSHNVINANGDSGVALAAGADDVTITGNRIGTTSDGLTAAGNARYGVLCNSANDTIGGTSAGDRNVIAANNEAGILIDQSSASGNHVAGNYIGTDAAGGVGLSNNYGIEIKGSASHNVIGGPSAGNVISGNAIGVYISGTAHDNQLLGNRIGVAADGTSPLGNSQFGVLITTAPNNTIGATAPGDGNVIAYSQVGVNIQGASATGNLVSGNSIYAQSQLGIDLNGDGPTANTPGGPHLGPNHLQNYPVLLSAAAGRNSTILRGTLNSAAGAMFHIELFENATAGGEGSQFVSAVDVMTDAIGNASFSVSVTAPLPVGTVVTTTATSAGGDTSEFAPALPVTRQGDITGDGAVNFADLLVLAQHYNTPTGATLQQGDLNGDGAVNFGDLLILAQSYGQGTGIKSARSGKRS